MPHSIRELLNELPGEVVYQHRLAARSALLDEIPRNIHRKLYLPLRHEFPQGLYSHQTKAIRQSLSGRHVALATSTASGKSLCFVLPTLDALLRDPQACALFVYPLKALSGDQLELITHWAERVGLTSQVFRLDGDIKGEERNQALARGRLFICTPDILHTTILRRNLDEHYTRIFKNLAYVVLDECHVYDGVFGSHMALVVRRLRQVCRNHGSSPRFIVASATIGQPHEHVSNLIGTDAVDLITEDMNGSPTAERDYFMVNPANTESSYGYIMKLTRELVKRVTQFVVFCNSRKEVEQYALSLRQDSPKMHDSIMPYRSGYESSDRSAIERALRQKTLLGVFSTSALEMGIDLPNLDICVMVGLPNSQVSLIQRAGRVGRRRPGAVIICGKETPFDEYYFKRPADLFKRALEQTTVNLSNPNLLISHYASARIEGGDFENPRLDPDIFGREFINIAKQVHQFDYAQDILYDQEPHFKISIRSIDDPVYKLGYGHSTIEIPLGQITYSRLMREAYPGGIYLHLGTRYRVKKVIFGKREVLVDRRCPFASTKPRLESWVKPKTTLRKGAVRSWPSIDVTESTLSITEKITGYLEKSASEEREVVYKQPLMRYFVTSGIVIKIKGLSRLTHGSIVGFANAIENSYPIVYRCARADIGSYAWSKEEHEGHIYLYDATPGGLGITSSALAHFEKLVETALDGVISCECSLDEAASIHGCIKCVKSNMWLRYPNSTRADTLFLLEEILRVVTQSAAEITLPQDRRPPSPSQRNKYGRTVLANGSVVYTGAGHEAVVISSTPMESTISPGERLYLVQGAMGESKSFIGSKLTLIQGMVELWCVNCGADSISMEDAVCPICAEKLI